MSVYRIFLLGLLGPLAAHAGFSCPEEFAHVAQPKHAYVLTARDLRAMKRYCQDVRLDLAPSVVRLHPPEFYLYLAYVCTGAKRDFSRDIHMAFLLSMDHAPNLPPNQRVRSSMELWRYVSAANPSFAGVSVQTRRAWERRALASYRQAKRELARETWITYGEDNFLPRLWAAKPFLTEEELKEGVRLFAEKKSASLAEKIFPGMYAPKAFQLAKQLARRELGMDYLPLTDLVASRSEKTVKFTIVSVDPIENSETVGWRRGFYAVPVATKEISGSGREGEKLLNNKLVRWKVGGRKYEARYSLTLGKRLEEVAPPLKTLDYGGLWADKKLTGAVFPGANMGVGEGGGAYVMDNYKEYFAEHGFRFAPPRPVANFEKFLQQETESGRLDYLVKEAHADGADGSLVSLVPNGQIVTGTKKLSGGKEEVVHIFYPDRTELAHERGDPLRYTAVADWMKRRRAAGGKQVFFVDTSCFGIGTACKLAEAVGDKNLVVAGSGDQLNTFTNESSTPLLHVLDGLRNKRSFPEMAAAIRQKARGSEDKYLLPGSPEWQESVYGNLPRSVSTEVRVLENGKPVDIETVGRGHGRSEEPATDQ